ncbi:MAG: glycosyltransferase family 4 protein [Thermoplasmata archaeon]
MPLYGGAEIVITKLIKGLSSKGIDAKLLTCHIPPGMEKDLRREDIILLKKEDNPLPLVWSIDLTEFTALNKWMRYHSDQYDVVNLHNHPVQFSIAAIRKPAVWTCNEPMLSVVYESPEIKKTEWVVAGLIKAEKTVVRRYIKNAVVADRFNYERFLRIYGFEPDIVPYGIDYSFFAAGRKEEAYKKFNLNPDDFHILHVGMFTPLKNQKRSVECLKNLADKIMNIKLVLVGFTDDSYFPELMDWVKRYSIEDRVIVIPHTSREDIRNLYKASSVLLHPVKPQGGWLAPFEAMCAGLPVVVSKEFTAATIVSEEGIGVVTDSYEDAVLNIFNNYREYWDMVDKAQRYVKEKLSWERYCERMIEIYKKTIQSFK